MSKLNAGKRNIRNIVLFCIIITVTAFIAPLLGGNPAKPGPGFVLWGTAPLAAAILIRIVTKDWSDFGLRLAFKRSLRGYLISFLICPILMTLTLLFGILISATSLTGFSIVSYFNRVLPGMAVFLVFAIFEEFGWRGYLAPKLASSGINSYLGYAVTAFVWATWHMPYIRELAWISTNSGDLITFIPRFYLLLFALSIIYGEIRRITGSVWPAVFLHCITNTVQHPLDAEYITIVPGMEYLVSFNGLFMTAAALALGISLNSWRRKNES